ncbi:hypothetical protein [Actinokineospora sp. HUAS TT18]|uniref:hypothetical protein n=1 Tax=Actinokineospora sp. HUAS TT18 TaxID=3447451 RepID=UPI003F51F363
MQEQGRRLHVLEWIGVLAGVGAVVVSFLPWQRVTGPGADTVHSIGFRTTSTAWSSGLVAWLAVLALLVAAVLLVARVFGKRVVAVAVLWLLLAVAALVLVIIRWVTIEDLDPNKLALLNMSPPDAVNGASTGLFACLGIALVSTAAAVARVRTAGRTKPAPVEPQPQPYPTDDIDNNRA